MTDFHAARVAVAAHLTGVLDHHVADGAPLLLRGEHLQVDIATTEHLATATIARLVVTVRVPLGRPDMSSRRVTALAGQVVAGIETLDTDEALWIGEPYQLSADIGDELDDDEAVTARIARVDAVALIDDDDTPPSAGTFVADVATLLDAAGLPVGYGARHLARPPAVTVTDGGLLADDPFRNTATIAVVAALTGDPTSAAVAARDAIWTSGAAIIQDVRHQPGGVPPGGIAAGNVITFAVAS